MAIALRPHLRDVTSLYVFLNTENIKICERITKLEAIKNAICLRFLPHLQKI